MKYFLKQLESKRLLFRSFDMSDAARIHFLLQEKEIIDNTLSIPYPYQKGMAEEWILSHAECFKHGEYKYAVILKDENALIGAIELIVLKEFQHANLGYWLGKPYWSKGYGTEMVGRMIQYGFEELNLHRMFGEHFDTNLASARVMQKNGMIQEGTLREHKFKEGKFLNSNIKGILRSEWEK